MSLPKHSDSWNKIGPPFRPTDGVIDEFVKLCDLTDDEGYTLLLGVTPEFYDRFDYIVGVEKDVNMIDAIWPGNTAHKNAVVDDWQTMSWPREEFQHIVGDIAITLLGNFHRIADFQRSCYDWLKPGGVFAQRVMVRPDRQIGRASLKNHLNHHLNWHAFKMLMIMCVAGETDGEVRLEWVLDLFNEQFPDRDAVAERTGWPRQAIDTIDLYKGIDTVTCVLTEHQWRATCPDRLDVAFVPTYDYPLAERCPILCWEKPR